ncbi:hypothetical protein V8E53_010267 [Lactarius tabidus]
MPLITNLLILPLQQPLIATSLMSSSVPSIFKPLRVGNIDLQHRVVMAPMTRFRANKDHIHDELAKTYYAACESGYANAPGIWSDAQITGWKTITDTVHANGSYIFVQLGALGRTADTAILRQEDGFDLVAPSPIFFNSNLPRELTVAEINKYVQLFSNAASNAIKSTSNCRTGEYGGSVGNRVRFPLEAIEAVAETVGAERTAVRISPWSTFQDMGMKDPLPTFTTLIERIRDNHPNLAYIHVIEARVNGNIFMTLTDENRAHSNEVLRKIWGDRPYVAAGGMGRPTAIDAVEKYGGLVAFGRHFIASPDLPLRLKEGLSLTRYSRDTFYVLEFGVGYIDYPLVDANNAIAQAQ